MNRAAIEAGVALSAKLRNELIPECETTIAWKPLETLLSAIEAAQALLAERDAEREHSTLSAQRPQGASQ